MCSYTVSIDTSDLEKDPDLIVRPDEPDSWSATIDKKTLKKLALHKKEVKRQENIFGKLCVYLLCDF